MSYQRATIKLSGMVSDLVPQDAPADVWNVASNVLFRNGEAVRWPGDIQQLPAAFEVFAAEFVVAGGVAFWVLVGNDVINVWDGATVSDVTPPGWTGNKNATFTTCKLNDVVYINASDRDPCYWAGNPAQVCQPLPDWPTNGRCRALRAHKAFLLGIGFISDNGARVRWSDAAEGGGVPQFWIPAADNLAGFVDLPPSAGDCLDGRTLRDDLMVMKGESLWLLTFVGGNDVFGARKAFAEHGLIATNALCQGPNDELLFMGYEGDVYVTNGVQVLSVAGGRVQREINRNLSREAVRVFSGVSLAREKLGLICFPTIGEELATAAFVYDFASGDASFRDTPSVRCAAEGARVTAPEGVATWDEDSESWDNDRTAWNINTSARSLDDAFFGNAAGLLIISDAEAQDYSGEPITAYLEKNGLSFGDAQTRKLVGRVWPKIEGQFGDVVTVRVGGQEITDGPVQFSAPLSYTIGSPEPVEPFVSGRFLSLIVTSTGGSTWRLGSMDVEYRGDGQW